MVIELTGEQEAMVLRVAEQYGKTPAQLVVDALGPWDWVEEDRDERRILAERVAAADRGDFLSETEMHEQFLSMLRPE